MNWSLLVNWRRMRLFSQVCYDKVDFLDQHGQNITLFTIVYNYLFINPALIKTMADKSISPYRKRFNTEIITKTEIALEAIKRYDMEQSKTHFFNHIKPVEKTILMDLDQDYSKLTSPKKMEADRIYKINLLPHAQEFYFLQMTNYIFPMKVLIKNVRNDGVMYVGYDHQYPGVTHHVKKETLEGEEESSKNYDYKANFNKDTLITLKNKSNKSIKCIYFTFISQASLLMFHFKVEFIGFSRQLFASEVQLKHQQNQKQQSALVRQKTEPIQIFKELSRSKFPSIPNKSVQKAIQLQEFLVFSEQSPQRKSRTTLSPLHKLSNSQKTMKQSQLVKGSNSSSQYVIRSSKNITGMSVQRGDVSQRLQEIKKNRQLLEIYKEKDKQLRETASKCKKLIQDYKKNYNEENVRKCKLNRSIVLIMYSMLFVNAAHQEFTIRSKKAQSQFKIAYLCKKFIRKLKKKQQQSCKMIAYRSKRFNFEAVNAIDLTAKLICKQGGNIASKILKDTFVLLMPMLSINRSLNVASQYRDKIKFIQRVWKSKYHCRVYSLLYFIDNHVEKMMKEYPHLKLFQDHFYKAKANRQISLNYMKDESDKYRFIYEAYLRKLDQIEEMIQTNKRLMKEGAQKPKLTIPKKPVRPMHRFYRNSDILKSMVRAWFQIQYKKYFKKACPKMTK